MLIVQELVAEYKRKTRQETPQERLRRLLKRTGVHTVWLVTVGLSLWAIYAVSNVCGDAAGRGRGRDGRGGVMVVVLVMVVLVFTQCG